MIARDAVLCDGGRAAATTRHDSDDIDDAMETPWRNYK